MLQPIRETFAGNITDRKVFGLVQVDETFSAGKNMFRHAVKKVDKAQWCSLKHKTPVIGMAHTPARSNHSLFPIHRQKP